MIFKDFQMDTVWPRMWENKNLPPLRHRDQLPFKTNQCLIYATEHILIIFLLSRRATGLLFGVVSALRRVQR